MRRYHKAFTLIELLVVIAIIALLLSILLPGLKMAKKQAQTIVCRSNLSQWGKIFALYANENEDKLPQSILGGNLNAQEAYWIIATLPYYEAKGIRLCPASRVEGPFENRKHGGQYLSWGPFDPANTNDWWGDFDAGGYGINEWCANPPPGVSTFWGLDSDQAWRSTTDKGVSRVPLFMDCMYVSGAPRDTDTPITFDPAGMRWEDTWGFDWNSRAMNLFSMDRHRGTINGVFLDLSANKVGMKELWRLKWHKDYNPRLPQGGWPAWMQKYKDY